MSTELGFEPRMSILLTTITSAPLLSTLCSTQKYSQFPRSYLLPPVSEPWHLLFSSRQRRASNEQVIPGLLFLLHGSLAQILCQRSSLKHSFIPFFPPNIVLWKCQTSRKVERTLHWFPSCIYPPSRFYNYDFCYICFKLCRTLSAWLLWPFDVLHSWL